MRIRPVRFRWTLYLGVSLLTAALFCFSILLTSGCAKQAATSQTVMTADKENTIQQQASISLFTDEAEELLKFAAKQSTSGEYDGAVKTYLQVYESQKNKSTYREQALLGLGRIYSELLNPKKNYETSIEYLEKLLTEFPETKLRTDAETRLTDIRALQKKMGSGGQ